MFFEIPIGLALQIMALIQRALAVMQHCRGGPGIMFLLPLVCLPRLAGAIYLITYTHYDCTGDGVIIDNVVPDICYDLSSELNRNPYIFYRSLTFVGNPVVCAAYAYGTEWCLKIDPTVQRGAGPICLTTYGETGLFSAGILCPDGFCPTELSAHHMKGARAEPQVAGVVYTEDPNNGTWILETGDAKELFTQLTDVAEDLKVKWLQARGASFRPTVKPSY